MAAKQIKIMDYTLAELERKDCASFGGNNCVLHGCMFFCILEEAKKEARKRENKFGS